MIESYTRKGIRYWREVPDPVTNTPTPESLFRDTIGTVLRERRKEVGLTLRQIPSVSMGYVSEVERGHKEMSSEVLQTLCKGLDISVPEILRRTADLMDGTASLRSKELVDA